MASGGFKTEETTTHHSDSPPLLQLAIQFLTFETMSMAPSSEIGDGEEQQGTRPPGLAYTKPYGHNSICWLLLWYIDHIVDHPRGFTFLHVTLFEIPFIASGRVA